MKSPLKIPALTILFFGGLTAAAFAVGQHKIDQAGLKFSEASVTLKKGETILFTNSDRTSHNITISGGAMNFNGGLQQPGQSVEVPFTAAGTFNVVCGIHPKMAMTVTVQ